MRRFAGVLCLFLLLGAFSLWASGSGEKRDFLGDVSDITGPLDSDQIKVAEISLDFYLLKYGYKDTDGMSVNKAASLMTDEEYADTVEKTAEVCQNGAAIAAVKVGKAGEKGVKAVINAVENAWEAGKKWVNENAEEYDRKKSEK